MVAVADLDLDGVDTVVLVTVVVVLVVAAAGFSAGFAVGPVVGSPAAGLASVGDLPALSPGTSRPSVSPRRRRGHIGLNHHMRYHRTGGIHHATSTKGPTGRRHKPRGHKRPARARNAAIGTGRIKPRGVDGKPTAGCTIAKTCILQIHAVGAHARSGPGARGNDAPAAAHGHVACDHAGDDRVENVGVRVTP